MASFACLLHGGVHALLPPSVNESPTLEEQLHDCFVPAATSGVERGMEAVAHEALHIRTGL
jgi:hypothetical protein